MGFLTGKRKSRDEDVRSTSDFPVDDLNDDVLERVLSWLSTSCFFRMSSVCKRWKSSGNSGSFKLACSQIPSRDPWFFMIDNDTHNQLSSSFVFDSTENNWKNLNHRPPLRRNLMPLASSGGLLCFRCSISGGFLVHNPVTGSSRDIPSITCQDNLPLHAVSMTTVTNDPSPSSYKVVMISGKIQKLSFRVYHSSSSSWSKEELELVKDREGCNEYGFASDSHDDTGTVYFLSKTGNVVASNIQRSPSKQYSSVISVKDNVEIVYFLSSYGTIVACDLTKRSFSELPRLLPPLLEYSIDLVECNGTMFVVLLSEFFESASLRIWRLEEEKNNRNWVHVGMLPPAMSHELYGKKGDINCIGAGDKILVCFNASPEVYRYFVYNLVAKEWSELPRCFKNGEPVDFVSALSFEPRIEATA